MGTNNLIIGQKERKRDCANHNSIIECDGRVGPEEGSQYCADCRTKIDVVCAECQTMFSIPRGLHQILQAQKKDIKCYGCLHGNGGDRETKPAAEYDRNPERKGSKTPDSRVRLHRQLHNDSLDPAIEVAISQELAEHIQAMFPGTMFVRASGHLLPAIGLGTTYPNGNTRPRVHRPKRVWKRPAYMKYLNPDEIQTGAIMDANLYKMSGGNSERKKDPFYYAIREVSSDVKQLERIARKVVLGDARVFLAKAAYEGYTKELRWAYVEDAAQTVNRFLRRLTVDGSFQRRCGLA